MQDITIDVLLEFLYNRFGVTLVFCLLGSLIRQGLKVTSSKKDIKSRMLDMKHMAVSSIFSTFLMCACADYIELQFSIYATFCVICGMWGLALCKIAINGKFMSNLLYSASGKISNPIIKSAVDSASKELEEQQKEEENKEEE